MTNQEQIDKLQKEVDLMREFDLGTAINGEFRQPNHQHIIATIESLIASYKEEMKLEAPEDYTNFRKRMNGK